MDRDPIFQWFFDKFGAMGIYVLLAVLVWSLVWKGFALWRAAKQGSKAWFIVLLIVNTAGILDILYYYKISVKQEGESEQLAA
jgi:hypothetical protein